MDFGLDDPLESDDSFFEEPKALTRKSSASKTPEKKSLETLFGLEEKQPKSSVTFEETQKPIVSETQTISRNKPRDFLELGEKKIEETQSMSRGKPRDFLELGEKKSTDFLDDILQQKPKRSTEPKSDALGDLFKSPKDPGGKKSDPLEDILKDSKRENIPRTPQASKKDLEDIFKAKDSSTDLGFSTPSSRRRGRRSSGIEDTLGILGGDFQPGNSSGKEKKDERTTKTKTGNDVPDWLGGSTQPPPPAPTKKPEPIKPNTEPPEQPNPQQHLLNPQQMTVDIQNTYSALHQQESYLLLTLQMKRYEESLQEMKNMQKEMMDKQEKRLGGLMEEYVLKEKIMENSVRLQQERINNQIQMLVSKPVGREEDLDRFEESGDRVVKMLKQRHEEELFVLEESYKKQINIVETSNRNLEEKLREELNSTAHLLEDKIQAIKTKYEDDLTFYKEKLKTTELQHLEEVNLLKEHHSRTLEELKRDHSLQLEYFKQMKRQEVEVLGKGTEYSRRIDAGIELLVDNAKVLQGIEEKVAGNYDVLANARESSIQTKEKEIILMRSSLEKCRQAAESERAQLLSLVRSLETKIAEQNHTSQEDRWALQQASATLTARASALEREQEYNRNAIEREREQLKTLKESMLAEQERLVMQLTEEKLELCSEKAKIDVTRKLSNTYEVEKVKAEAEAAIQATRELAEKVNQERNHLHRQKSEMEALRRNLTEREKELDEKEVELEFLIKDAQTKLREDRRVLTEAKTAEKAYKERLQELHHQWAAMAGREKKLSEEKVALSKERLAMYATTKNNKNCALCKDVAHPIIAQPPARMIDLHKNLDVEAFRLRMEVEDERESEVSREDISVHLSRG